MKMFFVRHRFLNSDEEFYISSFKKKLNSFLNTNNNLSKRKNVVKMVYSEVLKEIEKDTHNE